MTGSQRQASSYLNNIERLHVGLKTSQKMLKKKSTGQVITNIKTRECMRHQAEDQYNSANISLRESFNHFRQAAEQNEFENPSRPVAENVVSFQNTQTNFVDLEEIQEQEFQGDTEQTIGIDDATRSEEFLQLLQYSDQLNSKIDQLKQSTQKVNSTSALRSGRDRNQLNQTTPTREGAQMQMSSQKSVNRQKLGQHGENMTTSTGIDSTRQFNMSPLKSNYRDEQLINFKYELSTLREQLKIHEAGLTNREQNAILEVSEKQFQLEQAKKDKEGVMKLLKQRNENELKLQSEVLEKNNLIKDLTKKLKESTQIILSIDLKNSKMAKSYEQKIREKLDQKSLEIQGKLASFQEETSIQHSKEIAVLNKQLEVMKKVQKEAENYKLLYNTSKIKFDTAQGHIHLLTSGQQSSSDKLQVFQAQLSNLQDTNADLQKAINQMEFQAEEKDALLQKLNQNEKVIKSQMTKDFELNLKRLQEQSKSLIDTKDKEIQQMLENIYNNEKLSEKMLQEKEKQVKKIKQEISQTKQQYDTLVLEMEQLEAAHQESAEQVPKEHHDQLLKKIEEIENEKTQIQRQLEDRDQLYSTKTQVQTQLHQSQIDEFRQDIEAKQELINQQVAQLERYLDLAQDVEIKQKELEYARIEQSELQTVIENQNQRICAQEKTDASKDEQIREMKIIESELTETIEIMKIKSGSSSMVFNLDDENKNLLIEENNQLRAKEKELKKELEKYHDSETNQQTYKAEYVENLESQNQKSNQTVSHVTQQNQILQKEIIIQKEKENSQAQKVSQLQSENQEV